MAVDKEKKEAKRPAVHKVAIGLLQENPLTHFWTIACLYAEGAVMPAGDIPNFLEVFKEAYKDVQVAAGFPSVPEAEEAEKAIESLQQQLKESKKKEEGKKEK